MSAYWTLNDSLLPIAAKEAVDQFDYYGSILFSSDVPGADNCLVMSWDQHVTIPALSSAQASSFDEPQPLSPPSSSHSSSSSPAAVPETDSCDSDGLYSMSPVSSFDESDPVYGLDFDPHYGQHSLVSKSLSSPRKSVQSRIKTLSSVPSKSHASPKIPNGFDLLLLACSMTEAE